MASLGGGDAAAAARGDEFMTQGRKRYNAFSFFSDSKYSDAMELFDKAGAQYKLAKRYAEAAEAYLQAANCATKLKSPLEAATHHVNAGQCFKKANDVSGAVRSYETAIAYQIENNRFSQAAKLHKEMAEMYESTASVEQAVENYLKANDCFVNENASANGHQCLIRAANLLAELKQYRRAIEIYERVASESYNDISKWSVKDYFFRSLLCYLAEEKSDNALVVLDAQSALRRYIDEFPQFEGSRECDFVKELIAAREEVDEDHMTRALREFDRISPLDAWKSKLMVEVQKGFTRGGNSMGEGDLGII